MSRFPGVGRYTVPFENYMSEFEATQVMRGKVQGPAGTGLIDLADQKYRHPFPPTTAPPLNVDLQLPKEIFLEIDASRGLDAKQHIKKLQAGIPLKPSEAMRLAEAVSNHRQIIEALVASMDYDGRTQLVLQFPHGIMVKRM
jgi:hypothetical protein